MPRDNTPHRAIYAYIRSLIHPNGPEAHCFHAALRRSTDVAGRFACVYYMDVRRVAQYNWLLTAMPVARRHTRKIPISRNMRNISICIVLPYENANLPA